MHRSRAEEFKEANRGCAQQEWRPGAFYMAVDIKGRDRNYTLRETLDAVVAGCQSKGTMYEPLSPSEYAAVVREIKELVAYRPIPVTLVLQSD